MREHGYELEEECKTVLDQKNDQVKAIENQLSDEDWVGIRDYLRKTGSDRPFELQLVGCSAVLRCAAC